MVPHIDIILASYNGERFIKQQIFSILSQTVSNWTLYIHDDGSKDRTLSIIEELSGFDKRIVVIRDGIKFKNVGENFKHLLKFTTSDYICFCDQDDIWFENKLEILINNFNDNSDIPSAILSSAYLYQSDSNKILGLLDYQINNLNELLFINGGIHGCRAMINKKMKEEILRFNNNNIIHDHIMALIACSYGKIKFISNILFLYRQHDANVSGKIEKSKVKRFLSFLDKNKNDYLIKKEVYSAINYFFNTYQDSLSNENKKYIKEYLSMPNKTNIAKLLSILKNNYKRESSMFKLIILVLSRKYIQN